MRRGKNRSTRRKTSRSKGESQQQTQPTYGVDAGIRTRATLVGGEHSHHCAIPCSPKQDTVIELGGGILQVKLYERERVGKSVINKVYILHSLGNRRLEEVGARENGRAPEGVTRVSFSRARFFLRPLLPSAFYAGYILR